MSTSNLQWLDRTQWQKKPYGREKVTRAYAASSFWTRTASTWTTCWAFLTVSYKPCMFPNIPNPCCKQTHTMLGLSWGFIRQKSSTHKLTWSQLILSSFKAFQCEFNTKITACTAYLLGSFFRVFIALLLSPETSGSQGALRRPHMPVCPLQGYVIANPKTCCSISQWGIRKQHQSSNSCRVMKSMPWHGKEGLSWYFSQLSLVQIFFPAVRIVQSIIIETTERGTSILLL